MADQVYIFDTTLRDGEQSPGAGMTLDEKIRMAVQLEKLGVSVIEAGFPIASAGEFESVQKIAAAIKNTSVAGLARTNKPDIDAVWNAIKDGADPRIHIFIATSDIHQKHKLKMTREAVIEKAVEAVKYARGFTTNVEFSAEDATRSDTDYLCEITRAVIKAGASVVNLPDTVGYSTPSEITAMFTKILEQVSESAGIILSTHCHNDLGMAVANSLAALRAGVRQIEGTINGIGERAGNVAIEEIVMAMRTREDQLPFYTSIESHEIFRTSTMLSTITGLPIPRNKPIVGKNAFAHESGVHQDGVIKETLTYEIMTPESIGVPKTSIVLGKHSGKAGLKQRCQDLGFDLTDEQVSQVYDKFSDLADKKKEVTSADLMALIEDTLDIIDEYYKLEYVQTIGGNNTEATATIRIAFDGKSVLDTNVGDGQVDAAYKAIERITGVRGKLEDYTVSSVTEGKDSMGEARIMVRFNDEETVIPGRGLDTDVIEASVKAFLNAMNRHRQITQNGNGKPEESE